jgi:hypothetical protein
MMMNSKKLFYNEQIKIGIVGIVGMARIGTEKIFFNFCA